MLAITVAGYFLFATFLPFDLNFPYFLIQNEYIYAALFFVFCFCISKTKIRFALIPINKLGMVSFSVYLVHFLIVDLGTWLSELAFHGQLNKYLTFFLLFAFTVFATYFIAKWTYEYIEKYGMALGERLIERIKHRVALKENRLNSDKVMIQQNPEVRYSEDRSKKIAGK
jgi:peptidoglycan/LPS O-acetylase OafA/YrhL